MKCPRCNHQEDRVIDSRISKEGISVRRRRECINCLYRFTTLEEIVPAEIYVVKRDQRREEFSPAKIRNGLKNACWKRPISEDQITEIVERIQHQIEEFVEKEIACNHIGNLVMDSLRDLDEVAYVRFASVYRQFKDIDQFINEIQLLKKSGDVSNN
jgi:transcriptional repressor NrdR